MPMNASSDTLSKHTIQVSSFLENIGVCTHIPYTDGRYADLSHDAADLAYLGVHNVRDSVSDGASGSAPLSSFITLAQKGVKFTFLVSGGGAMTTASLQAELKLFDQINKAVPGSVVAIEGSNEINNAPITFNGVGGLQGAVDLQRALYAAVHGDTNLPGVAVDYFTGYSAGNVAAGPNPTTTAGLADYDTQHPYPNYGDAPRAWVTPNQALSNESASAGFGPAVYTETGYSTNGGTGGAVNADVQAKYSLDLLLDDAANGISRTYLYQLMDAYKPGSPQGDDGFGLFDPNGAPKAAATAIHNLTAILADAGPGTSTYSPAALAYSVTGLPSTGNSIAMQKSDGTYEIAVWNEPKIWDQGAGTELTAAVQNVTVQLGGTYASVKIFDPLSSTAAVSTLHNVSSVQLGLTDHPMIVQVDPNPVVTATDTLDVHISEDAWKGDAQYTIAIDGTRIGGVRTAIASHASGATQDVSLAGNWGAGQHKVTIAFINDAYGGTSATDRNLYVDQVTYDGQATSGYPATLLSNGAATFNVAVSKPASTLTLFLAEDAYQGDAQYSVAVDGKPLGLGGTVTALNSLGQSQAVSLSSMLSAGTHDVTVSFLNDAWGGTPSTDRNLYVKGIDVNRVPSSGAVASLYSAGTAHFQVVVPSA